MTIIDGKLLAKTVLNDLKHDIVDSGIKPGLAVIMAGSDPRSALYVKRKMEAAELVGVNARLVQLGEDASKETILDVIHDYNDMEEFHGIIVQLPLPNPKMNDEAVAAIDPRKDADGYHPETLKALVEGKRDLIPVMSRVILNILESLGADIAGKKTVVVAHNPSFIKGQRVLLEERGALFAHSEPTHPELGKLTQLADILIAAGRTANLITADMVKPGAVVIDIGIVNVEGKTVGCVDFDRVKDVASAITPVPGGVGPLTVAYLLRNTFDLAMRSKT